MQQARIRSGPQVNGEGKKKRRDMNRKITIHLVPRPKPKFILKTLSENWMYELFSESFERRLRRIHHHQHRVRCHHHASQSINASQGSVFIFFAFVLPSSSCSSRTFGAVTNRPKRVSVRVMNAQLNLAFHIRSS